MELEAVIFDWGGTLTPWRTIDYRLEWRSIAEVAAPDRVDEVAADLLAASTAAWDRARDRHKSSTFDQICQAAGVSVDAAHEAAYREFWEPATFTDPQAGPLFEALHTLGLRVGVLSNTIWPRTWHEDIFRRDGVLELIDGDVYSSEISWTKPHPEAFTAAMRAVGTEGPARPDRCVFVGDRLFDDIYGAGAVGMRTIYVPHSDIPVDQVGHTEGEPDAVVEELAQVLEVVRSWLTS